MMIADIIELSVDIEEIPAKVVGQRHTAIEAYTDAAVEGLVAHGSDILLLTVICHGCSGTSI